MNKIIYQSRVTKRERDHFDRQAPVSVTELYMVTLLSPRDSDIQHFAETLLYGKVTNVKRGESVETQ